MLSSISRLIYYPCSSRHLWCYNSSPGAATLAPNNIELSKSCHILTFLLSGTLRPDLIESASELASNKADAIKTHHNDTDLVRELRKQVTYPAIV